MHSDVGSTAETVASALARLRESTLRVTTPRRTIIEVLAHSERHLTSAEILHQVDRLGGRIGRASVFRALDTLVRLGIARPTFAGSRGPAYYLVPDDGHHAHLVCTSCGRVEELSECVVDISGVDIDNEYGIEPTSHLLEFYGLCHTCKAEIY